MHILVLNCGSSSLKFQLIETSAEQITQHSDRALAHGAIERIGESDAKITYQLAGGDKEESTAPVMQHKDAIQIAFDHLTRPGSKLTDPKEIEAVGHRIVHGGETFRESVVIDDAVLRQIEAVTDLAPLHNPHNLKGYFASRTLLPNASQVAVFDTAFHQTLPPRAYLYGVPFEFYKRDRLRRYGFHGTSHRYVSQRFANVINQQPQQLKLITCHLGNGCSACAIDGGKSVDTSMGFTPMDGLLMGTRSGDLDPGAVLYLVNRDPMGARGVDVLLNQHSGLAGVSGGSSDMRDLIKRCDAGEERARDAFEIFCYRVSKYIGAYLAVLGRADAILMAGGIGENSAPVRARIAQQLTAFGVELDEDANNHVRAEEKKISNDHSKIPVWVVPTNEELLIARDTFRLVADSKHS